MKLVSGTARSIRWQQYDRVMSTNKRSGSTDMTAAFRTISSDAYASVDQHALLLADLSNLLSRVCEFLSLQNQCLAR